MSCASSDLVRRVRETPGHRRLRRVGRRVVLPFLRQRRDRHGLAHATPTSPERGRQCPRIQGEERRRPRLRALGPRCLRAHLLEHPEQGLERGRSGFEDLAREYEDDGASFAVVYVNSAPRDDNVPYTMLLDSTGELVSKYNVKRVPRLFVVEDGTIAYAQDYYYEGYENSLRKAIDEALANEPEKGRQSALRGEHP